MQTSRSALTLRPAAGPKTLHHPTGDCLLVLGVLVGELLALATWEIWMHVSWGHASSMLLMSFVTALPLGTALLAWSLARRRGWLLNCLSFVLGVGITMLAGVLSAFGALPFFPGIMGGGLGAEHRLIELAVTLLTVFVTMAIGHLASPRRRRLRQEHGRSDHFASPQGD